MHVPKPCQLHVHHENKPGLLIFQRATLKNTERPGYEARYWISWDKTACTHAYQYRLTFVHLSLDRRLIVQELFSNGFNHGVTNTD